MPESDRTINHDVFMQAQTLSQARAARRKTGRKARTGPKTPIKLRHFGRQKPPWRYRQRGSEQATREIRTRDLSFTKAPLCPPGAARKVGFIGHCHQLPAATPLLPRFLPGAQGALLRAPA